MFRVRDCLSEFPKQTLLCANYITWTAKIQDSIQLSSSNNSELRLLQTENSGFMSELSGLVLRESDPGAGRTLANLILSQGYFGDMLRKLLEEEVGSTEDFVWLSRLRYYCLDDGKSSRAKGKGSDEDSTDDEAVSASTRSRAKLASAPSPVELRMMHSVVPYGYEYLSPHAKLVMTPLTERCYQILLIALDLHRGGMISGETATGKTETVKDFAKAVAKQCVGFNCSEDFHHRAFSKFLKGLACCGAWSCFDEFHRIDTQVLSVVAQQILTVQRALQAGVEQLDLEGSVVRINRGCALFVTTDSLQDDREHIPDNLKVLPGTVIIIKKVCHFVFYFFRLHRCCSGRWPCPTLTWL